MGVYLAGCSPSSEKHSGIRIPNKVSSFYLFCLARRKVLGGGVLREAVVQFGLTLRMVQIRISQYRGWRNGSEVMSTVSSS